jgi:hypothetical protein
MKKGLKKRQERLNIQLEVTRALHGASEDGETEWGASE